MQENFNKMYLKDTTNEKLFGVPDEYDYSKFSQLNEFILDDELKEKFQPIAKKLNLSQEALEMLLDVALEMSIKQNNMYKKSELDKNQKTISGYGELFNHDSEIPVKNPEKLKEYMAIASDAYSEFCSPKLKELFVNCGMIYHPELIKLFYKIGDLAKEDNIGYFGNPVVQELTPAQILYGPRES